MYELMASNMALSAMGLDAGSADGDAFGLMMWVMCAGITLPLVLNIFMIKPVHMGAMKLGEKDRRWGQLSNSTCLLYTSFEGNVIVIGVPDEENLSAGMRAADRLLAQLKEEYGLEYLMMINSEPHQRKDFSKGVFSEGTVGKMMPFVYVRGFLSHAGKVDVYKRQVVDFPSSQAGD